MAAAKDNAALRRQLCKQVLDCLEEEETVETESRLRELQETRVEEDVHFSVFGGQTAPGKTFKLALWVYLRKQYEAMKQRALS